MEETFHLGVKALIFDESGKILLLKRYSEKKERQTWDLPGGRVQKGESPEVAFKREVFEETGLQHLHSVDFVAMELTGFRISIPPEEMGLIFSIYQCRLIESQPIILSKEHCEFQWVSLTSAVSMLKANYPKRLIDVFLEMDACLELLQGS